MIQITYQLQSQQARFKHSRRGSVSHVMLLAKRRQQLMMSTLIVLLKGSCEDNKETKGNRNMSHELRKKGHTDERETVVQV